MSNTIKDSLYFQDVVDDMYQQFINTLEYERKLSKDFINSVANGKVYTGLQAKKMNLLDILGTFEDSINLLLIMTKNSDKKPKIVYGEENEFNLFDNILGQTDKIISLNKMLLFPLPEFKLYYWGY